MKLIPYPDLKERWRKVCKHVFNKEERWWEIFGDKRQWESDRDELDAAGCLEEYLVYLPARSALVAIVERNHDLWLKAAKRACEQAVRAQRLYPEYYKRQNYIGDAGENVIVAPGKHLVTCYRSDKEFPSNAERVADAIVRAKTRARAVNRAAVRRGEKRASLERAKPAKAGSERDDA